MEPRTVDQLIALLGASFRHSREHAAQLKALDQVAQAHPEIFAEYENYFHEIRTDPVFQKSHDRTVEAVDRLRTALLQDHD
jgi:hypothetical protein